MIFLPASHEALTHENAHETRKFEKFEKENDASVAPDVTVMALQERLWWGSRRGDLRLLRALEEERYVLDIEKVEPSTGWSALHLTAGEAGSASATTLLLDAFGADPNTRTSEILGLKSPLHLAASRGHYQCCIALIKRNARADARTTEGRTALHVAAESGSAETVKLLLCYAKDIDCRDDNGQSPLHLACIDGEAECVELLLKSGANHDVRDAVGRCPFDVLLVSKHGDLYKIAKLLGRKLPESVSGREFEAIEGAKESPDNKEAWIVVREGKMVETRNQRVAVFRTPLSAVRWKARFAATASAKPTKVGDLRRLTASTPTEVIVDKEDRDDEAMLEDPVFSALLRAKQEHVNGDTVLAARVLEDVRNAETELANLRCRDRCSRKEADASERDARGSRAECERLEASIYKFHQELDSERRGNDLLTSAMRLAQIGHPVAATSTDPKRLAKAAVFFLKEGEGSLAHSNVVSGPTLPTSTVAVAGMVVESATSSLTQEGLPPWSSLSTPVVGSDDDDDGDVEMLRELEAELKASGVRRYAIVARKLHNQELSWSQLHHIYLRGGPESLYRTVAPIGLTVGAVTAINLRFSATGTEDESQLTPGRKRERESSGAWRAQSDLLLGWTQSNHTGNRL